MKLIVCDINVYIYSLSLYLIKSSTIGFSLTWGCILTILSLTFF